MDRPEIVANKGYETFAEHYVNEGIKKKEAVIAARDSKMADFLRSKGVSDEIISEAIAIK